MSTLLALAERIEQSSVGAAIAESRYAFPVIEGCTSSGCRSRWA